MSRLSDNNPLIPRLHFFCLFSNEASQYTLTRSSWQSHLRNWRLSPQKPSLPKQLPTVCSPQNQKRKEPNPTTPGPYSKFQVGACILTTSGEFITGANVENAAYPVGTCAERVAFGTAVVGAAFAEIEVGLTLERGAGGWT